MNNMPSPTASLGSSSVISNYPSRRKFEIGITTVCRLMSHNSAMSKLPSVHPGWYVHEWLKHRNLKQRDLVDRTEWNKSQISEWVGGKERWNRDVLNGLARAIGVEPADLLRPPQESLLIGKVGAGAEIHRLEHPDILAGIPVSPGLNAPNVAMIEGDSQYPLQEGWLIFYGAENQGVPDECIGKLSVVQIKDGPTLLKTLKRAAKKGLFRLESWNAPPREDVHLEWAAKVKEIRPN